MSALLNMQWLKKRQHKNKTRLEHGVWKWLTLTVVLLEGTPSSEKDCKKNKHKISRMKGMHNISDVIDAMRTSQN
jgi:hypothetical protein